MGRLIDAEDVKEILYESEERITNNISDKITSFIRENYIPKVDYENRLKADMVAMLTQIYIDISEIPQHTIISHGTAQILSPSVEDVKVIIQEKINELKTESEE